MSPAPTARPNDSDAAFLSRLRVASPCAESWEAMPGGERVRSCDRCQHKVYNLSEMTADEAARLVREAEGRLCVRFYRRADGTMLTRDCPVGLRAVRRRAANALGAAFASVAVLWGASLMNKPRETQPGLMQWVLNRIDPQEPRPVMGAAPFRPLPMASPTATPEPHAVMGDVAVEPLAMMGSPTTRAEMGEAAAPPRATMGRVAAARAPKEK